MTIKTAMLLAAGRGERLQPLTFETPKPLLPIYGKPFIVHHIEKLAAQGIQRIVINVSYLADKIMTTLGDGSQWNIEIIYSYEKEPLGVGGGIQHALPLLGTAPFLLMSSDIYTDFPLPNLINQSWQDTWVHAVLTDKHNYDKGDFDLKQNHLIVTSQPSYIFGSIAVIDPIIFKSQTAGFSGIMPALNIAIHENKAFGEYYGNILNINTLKEYQQFLLSENPV